MNRTILWSLFLIPALLLGAVLWWNPPLQSFMHETPSQNKWVQTFRMNLGTEPPDLDPIKITDLVSFNVVLNLMRGLVQFGKGDGLEPAMASHWEIENHGKRYIFHIRKNARWSDGQPVRAQDFVAGWKRALTPTHGAEYAFFLFPIKNAEAYFQGKLNNFNHVGVHAIDNSTLVVDLEKPVAFFLSLMAAPIAFPAREDIIAKYGSSYTEAGRFLANGPYQLKTWRHDEKIILTPNPYYFQPATGVDQIEMVMMNDPNTSMVMYENNQLDFVESPTNISNFDIRRLKHHPDAHRLPLHAIYYLGFNIRKKPFDDPRVRKAFAYALDRNYYPKLLQSGQRAFQSIITPGLTGYNPKIGIPYNVQKAQTLLKEAGYPNGKGFPKVTLAFRTTYDIQKEMEIAQFLWKKNLNVQVQLENQDWKVFLQRLKNDPPNIYRLNWYVDYPDPDSFMTLFITPSGNNYTGWSSPLYDQWVQRGRETLDVNQRKTLYNKAQHLLLEKECAILPMYITEKLYLVKPTVHGLQLNGLNLILLDHLNLQGADHLNRGSHPR